ncbi:uncharacterized protein QC763_708588 [Podospora pseudopauciseta]|uniref:Uncharacterized protein n=1 Tax=Podospora pseudopauciseta TaxID=2093780 RepID=A0ABR0H1H5_9PEZI|nr:hypothetical protein QC763_708588 [Podospora pseudopauciseta]
MRSSNIATKLVSVNAKFTVSVSLAGASPETASAFAASLLADASAGKRKNICTSSCPRAGFSSLPCHVVVQGQEVIILARLSTFLAIQMCSVKVLLL